VIAIYMMANWAYFRVLTPAEVGAHKLVAAEMMQRIQGPVGAGLVSVAAMISIFVVLQIRGACSSCIQDARRFDPDDDGLGGGTGAFRKVRRFIQFRHFWQLDSLRDGCRVGFCTSEETPGPGSPV
jgi:hypothetical protein